MSKAIDYRAIWKAAHKAGRIARASTTRRSQTYVAAVNASYLMPWPDRESRVHLWHVDRMARCAAGETVMSIGIADRVATSKQAAQSRRYAVSIAHGNAHIRVATFSASLTASGGREYLAIARMLIEGNARNRSTFVAPLR